MGKLREGGDAILKAHQKQANARQEAQAKSNAHAANAKPTPTAEECNWIKMGILDLDSKEDDGSGPQQVRVTELRDMQAAGGAPYDTRNMSAEQQAAAAESSDRPRR